MIYLNRTKVKSTTTLNQHNRINNKVSLTKTFLYCNTCGENIQKNSILKYNNRLFYPTSTIFFQIYFMFLSMAFFTTKIVYEDIT